MNILQGIRIVDFTRMVAGPYATRIFADFGAQVIKVQSAKTATGAEENTRGYFGAWNRNKQSITLNMTHVEARRLAIKLIASSDVVVENFSPRVMQNWRLDYAHLKTVKKDIIMLSLSGMGHTGPWKNYVAYGATVQALGGFTHLTGYGAGNGAGYGAADGGGRPVGSGYAYGDTISGTYGAIAVLAALEHRAQTGRGLHIDLSEYEAVCTLIGPHLMGAHRNHTNARPRGKAADHRIAAPHGCYRCQGIDRWCVIAVFDEIQWAALCRAMGEPDWVREERFSTLSHRMAHADQLDALVEQWTARRSPESIVTDLRQAGIPCGVVQNARDLANDPHLQQRGFFAKMDHPVLGTTTTDRSPVRFKNMDAPPLKGSPLLGRDNRQVFVDLLGLTEEEYGRYIENGVIF